VLARGEIEAPTELTVAEFMLACLQRAQAGLRRKSIDELEDLLAYCVKIPRELWPPEVARFVDGRMLPRNKMRAKVRRLVDWTKLPRGRMRSSRADRARFYRNPNRVAAHLASIYLAERFSRLGKSRKRGRPRKGESPEGMYKVAALEAAAVMIRRLRHIDRRKYVNVDIIKELLKRGRTRRPADRFDW
jgi:hypothetical protein